jgi:hypothetical protein
VTRERDLRQFVEPEKADLQRLVAGRGSFTGGNGAAVRNDHETWRRGLGAVVNVEQTIDLNCHADLLAAFADRGLDRALVVVDKSARQTPQPVSGLDRTAAEHDAAGGHDHDRDRDLRVVPEDEAIPVAHLVLATFDDADLEGRAAVDAEVAHQANCKPASPDSPAIVATNTTSATTNGAIVATNAGWSARGRA